MADDPRTELKTLRSAKRKLDKQLAKLIEENRRLASERDMFMEAAATSHAGCERLRGEVADLRRRLDSETAEKEAATEFSVLLQQRWELAQRQLSEQGMDAVLPPQDVGALLSSFVDAIGAGAGMAVSGGELRLRVAVSGSGDRLGLVVPTPESPSNVREVLQEVVVSLRRPISG